MVCPLCRVCWGADDADDDGHRDDTGMDDYCAGDDDIDDDDVNEDGNDGDDAHGARSGIRVPINSASKTNGFEPFCPSA